MLDTSGNVDYSLRLFATMPLTHLHIQSQVRLFLMLEFGICMLQWLLYIMTIMTRSSG